MQPLQTLYVASGGTEFLSVPELAMGVHYFEGSIDFVNTGRLPMKGLLFSNHFVVPIASPDFLYNFNRTFNRQFVDAKSQTTAFSCIQEDPQTGWRLDWSDSVPLLGCEPLPNQSSPRTTSLQRQGFLAALSSAFPKQMPIIPRPGTPLTLSKTTAGDEGFLRFTFHVPDRRVNTTAGTVSPGTYCSPFRDGQKISSGFEAVGRFALPVPLPYKHLVLLVPPPGTAVDIGTVVPNFGQAGGGVEAFFPNGFANLNLHYHSIPEY